MSSPDKKKNKSAPQLIEAIRQGDETAFEQLFFNYYYDLCLAAVKITKSPEAARDVVQEVFLNIWHMRAEWKIDVSLKAYLYRAVWNKALNAKSRKKRLQKLKDDFQKEGGTMEEADADFQSESKKIVEQIWCFVDSMPKQRRFIFILHRRHGLTYQEIGEVLKISQKTVENHMGLALKQIRENIEAPIL